MAEGHGDDDLGVPSREPSVALCCPLVAGADSAPSEAGGTSPWLLPAHARHPAPCPHPQQAETVAAGPRKHGMAERHREPWRLRSCQVRAFLHQAGGGGGFSDSPRESGGEIRSTVLCADPGPKGSESSLPVIKETSSRSDQPTPLSNRQADQSPSCPALFSKD